MTFSKAAQLGKRKKQRRPGRLTGKALESVHELVWRRAGGRCEKWLESEGRRCGVYLAWNRGEGVVWGTGFFHVEYHHVTKRSQMGPDTVENYEACCYDCHRGKRGYHA